MRRYLILAATQGQAASVRYLLEHSLTKAGRPRPRRYYRPAGGIHEWASRRHGSAALARRQVNIADQGGVTPLLAAAANGHIDAVQALLSCGANPILRISRATRRSPAALSFGPQLAGFLLEAGANASASDSQGRPAIVLAAANGYEEIVSLLLKHGADPNATAPDGTPALAAAVAGPHLETAKRLIEAGATPDQAGPNGVTPLITAVVRGHAELATALLAAGADRDGHTQQGITALMAAAAGKPDMAALLLDAGAGVDVVDNGGNTALFVAAAQGNADLARLLLERGADPRVRNTQGDRSPTSPMTAVTLN